MDRIYSPECGIDYRTGLKNCMNNVVFYEKMLGIFLDDPCFAKAKEAFAHDDRRELFARMHELKGMSGNIALTALYASTVLLVELLRTDGAPRDEVAKLFDGVCNAYLLACDVIREHLHQPV